MSKKIEPSQHKSRLKKLEQERMNSIWHRIKECATRGDKEQLVSESNGYLYTFGFCLRPWKGWKSYEENLNELYIGEVKQGETK
jgi:hypothetical protein